MACFPLMIEIEGKTVIVIGGGKIALHKIKVMLPFGARIVAVSEEFCDELMELADHNSDRLILIQKRIDDISFTSEKISDEENNHDIDDIIAEEIEKILKRYDSVCFVIAATDNVILQSIVSHVCKEKNIPVNVVDVREKSSFYFPAVTKQDELVVAVSTGGSSPVAAGYIKNKIEGMLPDYYGKMINALGGIRNRVLVSIDTYDKRKHFFNELIEYGEKHDGNIPDELVITMLDRYNGDSD